MANVTVAKLFRNGRSQAVRLPREFRFQGDLVQIRRLGRGVLLLPMMSSAVEWFDELDSVGPDVFMPEGRQQPPTPVREVL
ncbi:MAG: antitoxin [Candidatus Dormibacteria bacterium]